MKIKLKDIKNYIEGNYKFYKDKLIDSPEYIKEQVYYRLYVCKDDCVKEGKCKYCSCPPHKKSWIKESCNNGERFPQLMEKDSWESFKVRNNVDVIKLNIDE
jgi:hypothetical protein